VKLVVHCKREPFEVLIDRTTVWGNPFSHKDGTKAKFKVATREEAIARYAEWIETQPVMVNMAKKCLKGKVLGCWCRPPNGFRGLLLCHGQILAGFVNDLEPHSIE